jgi:hypothetical protein
VAVHGSVSPWLHGSVTPWFHGIRARDSTDYN